LCLAILLAGTKFRSRDADASLNGQFDQQVLMELALYGIVLVLVYLRSGRDAFNVGVRPAAAEYLLWAYVAWASLSVMWSAAPLLTLVRAGQLLTVLLLARATVRELGPAGAVRALSSAVVGFVATCALAAALFQWARDPDLYIEGDFVRFAWFADHPITVAIELGLALVLLTADVRERGGWRTRGFTIPAWILGALFGTALVMTYARGPLIACVVGVAALVVHSGRRWKIALVSVAVIGISLVAGVDLQAVLRDNAPSFFLRGQDVDALTTFSGRSDLWQAMLPQIFDHFWLGYGYQASRGAILEVAEWAGHAHNALVQSVLDLGIVGTLLLVSAIATTFLPSRSPAMSRERPSAPFIPLVLFLLVVSITDEGFAGPPALQALALFTTVLAAAHHRLKLDTGIVSLRRTQSSAGARIVGSR
jgi:O-antigen ligase